MEKLTEYLNMGGYAAYVWPSFAAATVIMMGIIIISVRSLKRAQKTLDELKKSPLNET